MLFFTFGSFTELVIHASKREKPKTTALTRSPKDKMQKVTETILIIITLAKF